ncbi:MAG: beta-propeller domain-containing protein [Pseudomonadota bacterium]
MNRKTHNTQKSAIQLLPALILVLGAPAACSGTGGSADSMIAPEPENKDNREIEESDLYKLVGDWLYVQNPTTGLNVIDVSNPDEPAEPIRLGVTGEAGELYVRGDHALIVFKRAESFACDVPSGMQGWEYSTSSELVVAASTTSEPRVAARFCIPGLMVSSRIVGDILYLVTSNADLYPTAYNTWLYSFNIANPDQPHMADFRNDLDGLSHEVHVTEKAIFIAQDNGSNGTKIRYIDISDPEGVMEERGEIDVSGAPQGRFHMDAYRNMFRIVTFEGTWSGTSLHVIDVADPDNMRLMSKITGLAEAEELWGTRFDGEKVYIVTYDGMVRQTDPLWVISLEDPESPLVLGELEIPGWSNYIFPRGDRLVAVGRGDMGDGVAVTLYDVSDPTAPAELSRVQLGAWDASSEANTDYRGVRIVDDEAFGENPLIAVPYSDTTYYDGECHFINYIQVIDLLESALAQRGNIVQDGVVRRTVPIGSKLYSISDMKVSAIDISDRGRLVAAASVTVSDETEEPMCGWLGDDTWESDFPFPLPFGCSMAPAGQPSGLPLVLMLAGLAAFFAIRRLRGN